MNGSKHVRRLSYPYTVWMAIFVVVPLFIVGFYAFTDRDGSFTWEHIQSIASPAHTKALLLSVKLSVISTLLCFVLSLPLSMVIRNLKVSSNGFIIFIFILPMWMNFLLRTIAWQSLLEKTGVINTILHMFGLPGQNMINTEGAIILGMVYNYLPFMVLPIYNSLVKIHQDTFDVSDAVAYHTASDFSGHCQWDYDGFCTGDDDVCYFEPFGRGEDQPDRKHH